MCAPPSSWHGSNGTADGGPGGAWANGASTVSAVVYTELRVRSSRHQVARAAWSASGDAAASRMLATSPTSCVSTQRTTSAMVRRSSAAARKSGARSLAAVAYQNSPSAVVPSALAASHRSAATRQASRHRTQPVSGDQASAGAPLDPVGSMHHTRPNRARVAFVWRSRSPFTLAATTGPRHPRMAGTARLVVLPLCVGPTTTTDWAVSAATPERRAAPGRAPRRRRPAGGRSAFTTSGRRSRRVAQRAPRRAPRRPGSCGRVPPREEIPASSAPPSASGTTTEAMPATC